MREIHWKPIGLIVFEPNSDLAGKQVTDPQDLDDALLAVQVEESSS